MSTEALKDYSVSSDYILSIKRTQRASAAVLLITVVALGVILYCQPSAAGNYGLMGTLLTLGSTSLTLFIISTCVKCRRPHNKKPLQEEPILPSSAEQKLPMTNKIEQNIPDLPKEKDKAENSPLLSHVAHPLSDEEEKLVKKVVKSTEVSQIQEVPEVVNEEKKSVALQAITIPYLRDNIFPKLIDALENLVEAAVLADCYARSAKVKDKSEAVKAAFREGKKLFNSLLEKPEVYLREILAAFGKGRVKISVARRRMIAAFNSGNQEKYLEAEAEYKAISKGYDLTPLAQGIKKGEITLENFVDKLGNHFCVPDEKQKKIGLQILDGIFARVKDNLKVKNAFNDLKNESNGGLVSFFKSAFTTVDFESRVQTFLLLAFAEAKVPKELMDEWCQSVISHTLETQFKKTMKNVLGMMARQIQILNLLFDKQKSINDLFVMLDATFLASESSDCIINEDLQKDVLELQSRINLKREEKNRIAFVILKKDDTRTYEELNKEYIFDQCFKWCEKGVWTFKKLDEINKSGKTINDTHGVRLVAVPISVTNHPFKTIKNHETAAQVVGGAVKAFIWVVAKLLNPEVKKLLPKLEKQEEEQFDNFFNAILTLLANPIYNGAIGNTAFSAPFQSIISTKGQDVAKKLDLLAKDPELSFEKIRDVWVESIREFAEEFNKVKKHEM